MLGFASKAGKLSYGFEASILSVKKKTSKLLVVAEDISPKSCKECAFFAEKFSVRCEILEGIDIITLSNAVGKKCGIISVNDNGFAEACIKALFEGGNANDK